jgi:hypothetical protein
MVAPVQPSGRKVVERAVTGAAEPARALARPFAHAGILAGHGVARFVAAEAGASRSVIFQAVETLEAEAVVGQSHRPVGIAFARRDRISHAGDERVANLDVGD